MSTWTANGFVKETDDETGDDGRVYVDVGIRRPSTSAATALIGFINPSAWLQRLAQLYIQRFPFQNGSDASTVGHDPAVASRCRIPGGYPTDDDDFNTTTSNSSEGSVPSSVTPVGDVNGRPFEPLLLHEIISEEEIQAMERCGGGGYGDVYFLRHIILGDIALKRIREAGNVHVLSNERRRARREAKLWHGLRHPNVLEFHGIYENNLHFLFVSPFARNGTIMEHIASHNDGDSLRLLAEAAQGLSYLHSKAIIHGDVKAANILISNDAHALICDFGMSRPEESVTSSALQGAGSMRWMSPEVLLGNPRSTASDVWSLGMTISEVLSGRVPYAELRSDLAIARAITESREKPPQMPRFSSKGVSYAGAWKTASLCWTHTASMRPTMELTRNKLVAARPASYTLHGHMASVFAVAFSPNSRLVASASSDNTVRLWDVARAVQVGEPLRGHTDDVNSVAFSPDGTTLASCSLDCTLRLWDVADGRAKGEAMEGRKWPFLSVVFCPDGLTLASGSRNGSIWIWDSASRSCITVMEGHTGAVRCLSFSPDGRMLASGSVDGTVRLWNETTCFKTGEPLEGRTGAVCSIAFSPDGSTVASGSSSGTIHLWDTRTGSHKGSPVQGHRGWVYCVAFHPNSRLLASGSSDKTIRLWSLNATPPNILLELPDRTNAVETVAFSPDGKWLASRCNGNDVRLWDLEVLLGRT